MAIRLPEAPNEVTEFMEAVLLDLHGARSEQGAPAPISISPPVRLLSVAGDQVAEGGWLGAARQHGWRAVVEFEGGLFGLIDVEDRDGALEFTRLSTGARTEATLAAAAMLTGKDEELEAELAMIEAPEVRLSAIWLRSDGDQDLFLPFEGMPEPGFETRLVERETFMTESRDYARAFRAGTFGARAEIDAEFGEWENAEGGMNNGWEGEL